MTIENRAADQGRCVLGAPKRHLFVTFSDHSYGFLTKEMDVEHIPHVSVYIAQLADDKSLQLSWKILDNSHSKIFILSWRDPTCMDSARQNQLSVTRQNGQPVTYMCRPRHKRAKQRQRDNIRRLNYQQGLSKPKPALPHREQVTDRGTAVMETQSRESKQRHLRYISGR